MAWSSDFLLNKLKQIPHHFSVELVSRASEIQTIKESDINTINMNFGIKELVIGFIYLIVHSMNGLPRKV